MTTEMETLEVVYIGTDNSDLLATAEDYSFASGNGNHILNIEDAIFALEIQEEEGTLSRDEEDLYLLLRTAELTYPEAGDAIVYAVYSDMKWIHPAVRES